MAMLRAQYIKEQQPQKLSSEEQNDSVDRLFYQQLEWQQEKKKQLEKKWLPRRPPTRIDDDTVNEMVNRLGTVPEHKAPESPPPKTQTHDTTEECVQRLHYFALEFQKRRQKELEQKYLWGDAKPKVAKPDDVAALVDRHTPARQAQPSVNSARRR